MGHLPRIDEGNISDRPMFRCPLIAAKANYRSARSYRSSGAISTRKSPSRAIDASELTPIRSTNLTIGRASSRERDGQYVDIKVVGVIVIKQIICEQFKT